MEDKDDFDELQPLPEIESSILYSPDIDNILNKHLINSNFDFEYISQKIVEYKLKDYKSYDVHISDKIKNEQNSASVRARLTYLTTMNQKYFGPDAGTFATVSKPNINIKDILDIEKNQMLLGEEWVEVNSNNFERKQGINIREISDSGIKADEDAIGNANDKTTENLIDIKNQLAENVYDENNELVNMDLEHQKMKDQIKQDQSLSKEQKLKAIREQRKKNKKLK